MCVTCRCILWDLSRSFLLRLAITIFSIILIYTMAQVNVVSTPSFIAVLKLTLFQRQKHMIYTPIFINTLIYLCIFLFGNITSKFVKRR